MPPTTRTRWAIALAGITLTAALSVVTATSVSAAPDPAPDQVMDGNLIWNGSLDVADLAGHPLGWTVEGNEAGVNVVNRTAFRTTPGGASLQIADKQGSVIDVRSKRVPALPNTPYTLTLDTRSEGTAGQAPWISLEFWGMPAGSPEQQGPLLHEEVIKPSFSTDWQQLTVKATAPEGTVQVAVHIHTPADASGTTHLDSARLVTTAPAYSPDLGEGREVFVDDHRIESAENVGRTLHRGTKDVAPLIKPDQPWERAVYTYGSVIKLPRSQTYRAYYDCNSDVYAYGMCVAETRDFKRWHKPRLGIIDYKGSKENNIVAAAGGSVAYNPNAPADRRFSFLHFKQEPFGYHGYVSADGLNFRPVGDQPLLPGGDVINLSYDTVTEQYIATYKDRFFQADQPGTYERSAFISTSKDFLNWTPRRLAVSSTLPDDAAAHREGGLETQVYGMPTFRYGNQFVGIPWDLQITDFTTGRFATAGDGPVVPGLASSRDLVHWDRAARGPLIEPGDAGAWDDGALYTSTTVLEREDTVEMLYGGFDRWHGGGTEDDKEVAAIGRAVWRRDGFVSMRNGATQEYGDRGLITTKPITVTGDLHVNAQLATGGSLVVEVLDADTGEPLPGFGASDSFSGDDTDHTVSFRGGSLSDLERRQVKLRFGLTGGDLYSYWFAG